ncbi:double zinc ribbon domain-containing protein [Methanobrevibacter sp.]|uniref:zinc ribbon domain-containing protein n=1 Tax=Methanobrevibacter sp. TaxID=66852 RepID=UPI00388F8AF8
MVICPDCGMEVPDAKFCKNCGAQLPEVVEEDVPVEVEETVPVNVKDTIPVEATTVEESSDKVKFCRNCGYKLEGEFKFCPNCGYDLEQKTAVNATAGGNYVQTYQEKSVLVSVILSVILPGLGHFYLGLSRKGAIFLLAYVVSAFLILLLIGFILVLVIWIWALVDVIQSTNALNRGESVEDKLL